MRTYIPLRLLYLGTTGILFTLCIICLNALGETNHPVQDAPLTDGGSMYTDFLAGDSLARRGWTLWRENACGACHDSNMQRDMTAPALAGVTTRWSAYPREDLYRWVQNSQRLLGSGHPRATELWAEWGPSVMSNYANLSDEDVAAILAFVETRARG
ncbi:cytochrome c [Neolewinella xylanilytica]|uniref:Cytochrome c n=1 Tax=Neolewinella xylanilytica TaxID=1514080 RepID=A0A2S6IB16_9BACT|nr:cytochrome c [Neolewinella xylanilytica]PPK88662.1 cytochrome c [Neolewinella xylanilytica]